MTSLKNLLLATVASLVWVANANAATMYFDFGDTAQQTGGNYNNVTPSQLSIFNVIDSTGAGTGIVMDIGGFNELGPNVNGTTTPTGAAAIFDPQATRDNLFGHSDNFNAGSPRPLGQILLSGLNTGMAYDFTFFASRMNVTDNRETQYSVSGSNNGIGYLNASNNTSNVAVVSGISPDAMGQILIDVAKGPNNSNGSGFFYLGAMSVTCIVPEPTSGLLLLFGCAGLVMRRGGCASRRLS